MTTVTTTKPEDEPPVTTSSPNTVVAGFGEMPNAMPPLPKPAQWKRCKASSKSIRTTNPIRAIVDPIVKSIQSGEERGDGKNHISLAVRCLERRSFTSEDEQTKHANEISSTFSYIHSWEIQQRPGPFLRVQQQLNPCEKLWRLRHMRLDMSTPAAYQLHVMLLPSIIQAHTIKSTLTKSLLPTDARVHSNSH